MEPAVLNLDGGDSLAPDVSIRRIILIFDRLAHPFSVQFMNQGLVLHQQIHFIQF